MDDRAPSTPAPDVDVERLAGTARVVVRGDLDLGTVPVLEQRLGALLHEGVREVLVDLREVSFCDVTGLNLLLRAQSSLAGRAGRLTLVGPCPSLEIMLSALGLPLRLGGADQPRGPAEQG